MRDSRFDLGIRVILVVIGWEEEDWFAALCSFWLTACGTQTYGSMLRELQLRRWHC